MRRWMSAAAAACLVFALGACSQGEEAPDAAVETASAPTNARDQLAALDDAAKAQRVIELVRTGPGGPRPCELVSRVEEMGVVPADIVENSPHRAHIGASTWAVHCMQREDGALKTDGSNQWVVYFPADSLEPIVSSCMPEGATQNVCWWRFQRQGEPPPGQRPGEDGYVAD